MKDIGLLTFGMACVDILFTGLKRMPVVDGEEYAAAMDIQGGGAANTPVAAAKLGVPAALLTVLGEDTLGDLLHEKLAGSGLVMDGVLRRADYRTAASAVLTLEGGARGFASYGMDFPALPETTLAALFARSRHLHTYLGYCLHQPLLDLAAAYGLSVSLDLSGADAGTLEEYAPYLRRADYVLPNADEARALTGEPDVERAAAALARYARLAVVKDGARGAVLADKGGVRRVPGVPGITPVDTTGAGDCFNAGFLTGLLTDRTPDDAARLGCAAGALAVTLVGGMNAKFSAAGVKTMERLLETAALSL